MVRIIGGAMRSRLISFPDIQGLRPTQDRIRETLFNWLAPFISGAVCLDLFAGSGVLGFEALSRGARFSYFIDDHPQVLAHLRTNAERLAIPPEKFAIIRARIPQQSQPLLHSPFDIVFLDPPFRQNLLASANSWLLQSDCLRSGALIYMEMERDLKLVLPEGWEIFRQQHTRSLIYQLVRVIPGVDKQREDSND